MNTQDTYKWILFLLSVPCIIWIHVALAAMVRPHIPDVVFNKYRNQMGLLIAMLVLDIGIMKLM